MCVCDCYCETPVSYYSSVAAHMCPIIGESDILFATTKLLNRFYLFFSIWTKAIYFEFFFHCELPACSISIMNRATKHKRNVYGYG